VLLSMTLSDMSRSQNLQIFSVKYNMKRVQDRAMVTIADQ